MTKLFFRVGGSTHKGVPLWPSDDACKAAMHKYSYGDIVTATVRRPRNPKHHRKMFALLNLVWEGTALQGRFPKMENLLDALKVALGHVELFEAVDGTKLTKPKSINFESLDQAAFEEFYNGVVEIVVQQLVPHLSRDDLEREVEKMIDGKR